MKVTFWLLDINSKIDNGNIELWLWGITDEGERVLILDRNFTAYFYAVLHGGTDGILIAQKILLRYATLVAKTEVMQKRFFGKLVTVVKVSCKDSTQTVKTAKQVRKIDGVSDCYEEDIRPAMRYLIDNGLAPCSWHEVDATEEQNTQNIRVSKLYSIASPPRLLENRTSVPTLRLLAFSMIAYSCDGSPEPQKNPVVMLSTVNSIGEEKQFIAGQDKDDKLVIESFISYIREFDPDVLVSYGANTTDWNYLLARSHLHGLSLDFDRATFEPHTSVYGHVSVTGIINLDLADFTSLFPEVKVKTLANFAETLEVTSEKKDIINEVLFSEYWDNLEKRPKLIQFSMDSANRIIGVSSLLLDFAIHLSSLTSLPLDQVMSAATGFRVEWYLIKRAQKIGEIVPRRLEQTYLSYAGGLVLSPIPGLHDNIAILDFKSMYPNIMITYNISPDTYIQPGDPEPPEGVNLTPEVGYRFRKAPIGFYKEALTYLIEIRAIIRQKMKSLQPRTIEYQVLDARQKAVKILTNAIYGYAGWVGARWYIKPVAEAASAWGRQIILKASKMAEQAGIEVIYGDTDSLFIKYDKAKAEKLQENIERDLKLDVEIGEVYLRVFFTEAKKRYAGLRRDGSLDIVGLEVIRGDWAQIAKIVQEHVLEIILKEQSPKNAVNYVHSIVNELRHKRVLLNDLIIWKTLTKAPADYAIRAPHVEAAKILIGKGWNLGSGDKVGYIVLAGKGPIYTRVIPYMFAKQDQVDIEYYVSNQVLSSAVRILSYFNLDKSELELIAKKEKTKSLTDFF